MAERLETLLWLAFFAAVSANTVEAFAHPDAPWWDALRFGLATLFAASLVALVSLRLARR